MACTQRAPRTSGCCRRHAIKPTRRSKLLPSESPELVQPLKSAETDTLSALFFRAPHGRPKPALRPQHHSVCRARRLRVTGAAFPGYHARKMRAAAPVGMGVGLPRGALSHRSALREPAGRGLVMQRFARPVTRSASRSRVTTRAMGDPFAMASAAQGISAVVASVAVCWGAVALSRTVAPEQDQLHGREACPACGGTGYETCFCTKWSDGDVGCSACAQTGYMKCRSCGGGGTAVPIPITVRRDGPN